MVHEQSCIELCRFQTDSMEFVPCRAPQIEKQSKSNPKAHCECWIRALLLLLPEFYFISLQLWQMLATSAVSKCPWTKSEAEPEFKVELI